MSDQQNNDDLHRFASEDLEDALLFGSKKSVIEALKKLSRLDGYPLQILIGQLEGSISKNKYRNTFSLKQSNGKPPSITNEPSARRFVARTFDRFIEKGMSRQIALFETGKFWEIGKTKCEEILAEEKLLRKLEVPGSA